MLQIIEIKNPFEPDKKDYKQIKCRNGLLTDYAELAGKDVFINGRQIEHPEYVTPTDGMQIIIMPHVAGGAVKKVLGFVAMIALAVYAGNVAGGLWGGIFKAGSVAATLASGAVMYIGGKIINAILPQDSVNMDLGYNYHDNEANRSYGWDLPVPTTTAGYTIGETYGECMPSAQLLEQHVETVNDKQYLNLLYCGGFGPVDSIDNIRIDYTDISNFSNVEIETRLGYNDQEPISFFKNTPLDQSVGLELTVDLPLIRTSNSTKANILEITLEWPAGLYYTANDGSFANATVKFQAEYRKSGVGEWHTFNADGSPFSVTNAGSAALRRSFQVTGLEADQYDVRVTMLEQPKTSRYQTLTHWTLLTSYVDGIYSRPNKVLVALRILATNQLSGGVPSLNWRQKRLWVWVFDPDQDTYVQKAADNPIWACYDILHGARRLKNINTENMEITVAGYPHEAFDAYWDEWVAAADYADEMITNSDGELEPRYRFDAFFDTSQKRWDAAQKAALVGHAALIMHGRNIGIVVDRPGTMTQIFGEGRTTVSSVKGSFAAKEDRARAIEVTYNEVNNDFKNTVMTIRSLNYNDSYASDNTAQLRLFGVKRRSQAYREAVTALATNERQVQFIELGADIDVNINTVTLDHEVTLEPDKMYELYIQLKDDTLVRRDVIPGNGKTNEITIAEPFDALETPEKFDNYAFGELDKAVKPFRVVAAQRDGDMKVRLKLAEYDEAMYSAELDYSKYPIIDYSYNPIVGNIIESLTATEETYTNNEGVLTSNIILNWELSRDANYVPDSYRITVLNRTTGYNEEFTTRTTNQYVRNVTPEATYDITVRCVYDAVVVGSVSTDIYITGKDMPPPDVTGLSCRQMPGGFLLTWDSIEIKDLRGFNLYQGRDGIGISGCEIINYLYSGNSIFVPISEAENYIFYIEAVDNGGNKSETPAAIIVDYILPQDVAEFIAVRNGETINFSWKAQQGMSYELRWGTNWETAKSVAKLKSDMYSYFFPQIGTQAFCIKAVDEYGNFSQNASYVSLDLTDGVNRNVIATFVDQANNWPGTKNNVHVLDGHIVLDDNVTAGEYITPITLPEAVPARNWIQYHGGTVAKDVTWAEMLDSWKETKGAWYPVGDLGSAKIEHYIATYTGLPLTVIDAVPLNNSTESEKGAATVTEEQKITYNDARFAQGAVIDDLARLAYDIAIPDVFHLAFNAKHQGAVTNHIVYMTLMGNGFWMRLGYNGKFYLLDSSGQRIEVELKTKTNDILSFTIDQYADTRALTVKSLASGSTETVSAGYVPLGAYTAFKME